MCDCYPRFPDSLRGNLVGFLIWSGKQKRFSVDFTCIYTDLTSEKRPFKKRSLYTEPSINLTVQLGVFKKRLHEYILKRTVDFLQFAFSLRPVNFLVTVSAYRQNTCGFTQKGTPGLRPTFVSWPAETPLERKKKITDLSQRAAIFCNLHLADVVNRTLNSLGS